MALLTTTNSANSAGQPSDEQLYRWGVRCTARCAGRNAWARLYERHCPALVSYLRGFGADIGLAEESVDEAFLRLIAGRPPIGGTFGRYMRRAARNALVTALRRGGREQRALEAFAALESSADVRSDEAPAATTRLAEALSALPSGLRRLIVLRVQRGLSLAECRKRLGWTCSLSACKYRYRKGLQTLRNLMQKSSEKK